MSADVLPNDDANGGNQLPLPKLPRVPCPAVLKGFDYTNKWAGVTLIHEGAQTLRCLDLLVLMDMEKLDRLRDTMKQTVGVEEAIDSYYDWFWLYLHHCETHSHHGLWEKLHLNLIKHLHNKKLWTGIWEVVIGATLFATSKSLLAKDTALNTFVCEYPLLWFCSLSWERCLKPWICKICALIKQECFDDGTLHLRSCRASCASAVLHVKTWWKHCNRFLVCQGLNTNYKANNDLMFIGWAWRDLNWFANNHRGSGDLLFALSDQGAQSCPSKARMAITHSADIQQCIGEWWSVAKDTMFNMDTSKIVNFMQGSIWNMTNHYGFDGNLGYNVTVYRNPDKPVQAKYCKVPYASCKYNNKRVKQGNRQFSDVPFLESYVYNSTDHDVNKAISALCWRLAGKHILKLKLKGPKQQVLTLKKLWGMPVETFEQRIWDLLSVRLKTAMAILFCMLCDTYDVHPKDTKKKPLITVVCSCIQTWQVMVMLRLMNEFKIFSILQTGFTWLDAAVYTYVHDLMASLLLDAPSRMEAIVDQKTNRYPHPPPDWQMLINCLRSWPVFAERDIFFGFELVQWMDELNQHGAFANFWTEHTRTDAWSYVCQQVFVVKKDFNKFRARLRKIPDS